MIAFVAVLAFVIEFFLTDSMGGMLVGNPQEEFIVQTLAVLLTLGAVFFALRLFKFKYIEQKLKESPLENYYFWSVVRMAMLEGPLVFNIAAYWLFVNGSFGWLGAILFLSFAFIYPSEQRFVNETGTTDETKTDD